MKPAAFDYVVADSLDMAVAALANAGDEAKIIAGGQSLVPMLNFRLLRPSVLVDINRIGGLAFIEDAGTHIRVGALTRHYQLETSPLIARHLPVLACAMTHVAHLAIRNRGTIGGSLSHADPAAELPMMALLLDAELQIVSANGKRKIAARDFLKDTMTVDLASDEIVTEILLPKLPPKYRLGLRGSRAPQWRFRAGRCGRDLDGRGWQNRAKPHCAHRRRTDRDPRGGSRSAIDRSRAGAGSGSPNWPTRCARQSSRKPICTRRRIIAVILPACWRFAQ